MFLEIHMIQSFSPSNLNRDDTNNPKDCQFGGVRRARISSQCIKRAMRTCPVFAQTTRVPIGIRTRWLMRALRKRLVRAGKAEEEIKAILPPFVSQYASKLHRDGKRTAVLLYMSEAELESIVETLHGHWLALVDEATRVETVEVIAKRLAKAHSGVTTAPDIALFGRMLAEKPELNLEAACQVAHALSTHRVVMEMDFFTAVDDLQTSAEPGAGMMGVIGYDSACFYRYARIHWNQLVQNLGGHLDLSLRTVEGFLRAAIVAVPTGKQNSFAAHNPPSLALAVVREDGMGWSLANAFERPVRPDRMGGLVAPSVAALDAYWERVSRAYGTQTLRHVSTLVVDDDLPLKALAETQVANLDSWARGVTSSLAGGEAEA